MKYYVEQGAGLETLVLPALIGRSRDVSRYLEIGCGFGFGLDFARRMFHWRVKGIDPGALARAGGRQLGVDIENRYVTGSGNGELRYDLIAAVEVLEHFARPQQLFEIMRELVTVDGLLILTTPNASYIEPNTEKAGTIAALSPGSHAVIFSETALRIVLGNMGFQEFKIQDRGATLLLAIGRGAENIDFSSCFDLSIYRAFLLERAVDTTLNPTLRIGYNYRLFKLLVTCDTLDDARTVFYRLEALISKRYGLFISDNFDVLRRIRRHRHFAEIIRAFPVCLPCIYFFAGILHLNGVKDAMRATELFFTSMVLAKVLRRSLLSIQIDDGELSVIETQARIHAAMVLDPRAPWKLNGADLDLEIER